MTNEEEHVTSSARVPGGVTKFRMKPVSYTSMQWYKTSNSVCVISSRLASHLSVVSAVMDGTQLNTKQLVWVCCEKYI